MMKLIKLFTDFLFATILSVFLVFLLLNIIYSKRDEVKLGLLSKLADFQLSIRDLYLQSTSKVVELKFVSKNNKLS